MKKPTPKQIVKTMKALPKDDREKITEYLLREYSPKVIPLPLDSLFKLKEPE